MFRPVTLALGATLLVAAAVQAAPVTTTFAAAGSSASDITTTRDAFRNAIGGGTVPGSNGSFGGVRREINWDGVPDIRADPNVLPADFFNTSSPRGAVFSTPGTGFLVSANAGQATPILFGFASDFQAFSPQRLFTAVGSNITDVRFFLPGTSTPATTSAFGAIFTDVEIDGLTKIEFFDDTDTLFYSRNALVSGNQGFSFLGGTVAGGSISRVRITSGLNTILANGVLGNPNDDVVAMDDFIFAEPVANRVPLPSSAALAVLALAALWRRRRAA